MFRKVGMSALFFLRKIGNFLGKKQTLKKFRAAFKCIHFNGTPFADNHDSNTHPFRCDLNEYNYGWEHTEKGSLYERAAHPVTNNRIMCSVDVSCFFCSLFFNSRSLSHSCELLCSFYDTILCLMFGTRQKAFAFDSQICFFPSLCSFTLFSIQTS